MLELYFDYTGQFEWLYSHCKFSTMERFENAAHCDQQPNYTLPHLPEVYWKLTDTSGGPLCIVYLHNHILEFRDE